MNYKTVLLGLTAAYASLGCSTTAERTSAAGLPVCLISGTAQATCDTSGVCPVYVFNSKDGPVVFPYRLRLPRDKPLKIVWRLLDSSTFTVDDGPKDIVNTRNPSMRSDLQFSGGTPATDPTGSNPARAGQYYRLDYKSGNSSQGWRYSIQFRDAFTGQVFKCDPVIDDEGN